MAAICLDNSLTGCIKNPRMFVPLTILLLHEKKITQKLGLTHPFFMPTESVDGNLDRVHGGCLFYASQPAAPQLVGLKGPGD